MPFLKTQQVKLLFLALIGVLIYSNTFKAPFLFDDVPSIVQNPYIRLTNINAEEILGVASRLKAYSNRPIGHISFALNYYLHKYDTMGYHLVNILIHIITGVLLYLLIETTLKLPTSIPSLHHSNTPPLETGSSTLPCHCVTPSTIALSAAIMWLVHPVQTQSVTYVVQRMTAMAAMFYLLCLFCYVKGRLATRGTKSLPWFAAAALAAILAIGSKEIAATLPFFVLLYEWYFFQDLSPGYLKLALPYMAAAIILFGLLVFVYLGSNPLNAVLSGYAGQPFSLTQRVLTEFRVVIYYISLLVYPHPSRLNLDHDFSLSQSLTDPVTTLFSMAAIIILTVMAIHTAKKQRLISFCILWFLGNLAIESSIIPIEIIYEHRCYLPSMFFFLPILYLAFQHTKCGSTAIAVAGAIIVLSSVWTYQRNAVWKDPVTLWTDSVRKSAGKPRPYNNLGLALAREGRFEEAVYNYEQALHLDPEYAKAHNNLGFALAEQESLKEAIGHYRQALEIKPDFPEAHNNLGNALVAQKKVQKAVDHYFEALRLYPGYAKAHNNLGNALAIQGRFENAIYHYSKALQIDSGYAGAHNNWGNALAVQGRYKEAIEHYSKALEIIPGHARAQQNLKRASRMSRE